MSTNLESHVKSIESIVRKEYFQSDISGVILGVTGDNPFHQISIECLIRKLGGMIDNDDVLKRTPKPKYIVVGRENYDEDYLQNVVNSKVSVIFLTQESFIDYILFGADINNPHDAQEINNHPGLSCIDNLGGFPSLISPFARESSEGTSNWKDKSFLRAKYGYHTGMLYSRRKECLIIAVREEGLRPVAYHISWLVRLNMRKGNIKDATNIWIRDLDWLKHTYHGRDGDDFIWPVY